MQLIRQELSSHCLLASAAMVLDVTQQEIMDFLGHDGCRILDPNRPHDPDALAGYHIQEIIDFALLMKNMAVTEIEATPAILFNGNQVEPLPTDPDRLGRHINRTSRAIFMLLTKKGTGHAVAFDGQNVYDPRGKVIEAEKLFDEPTNYAGIVGLLRFDPIDTDSK